MLSFWQPGTLRGESPAGCNSAASRPHLRAGGCHPIDFLVFPQDKDSQVLWWVLMGCDPAAWRPSPMEAAARGEESNWAKNRNMVLRWEALEMALQQVGGGRGDVFCSAA